MNLQALETEGAKIATLLFLLVFFTVIVFVMHETHHDPAETGRTLISNALTSISTLLLAKLGDKPKI